MNLKEVTFNNLIEFYSSLTDQHGFEKGEFEGISYVRNLKGNWPCFLLGGEMQNEKILLDISAGMESRVLPPFWIKRNDLKKDKFDEMAGNLGIRQVNFWRGMEMVLKEKIIRSVPDEDILVQRIDSKKEILDWVKVVNTELLKGKSIQSDMFFTKADAEGFDFFSLKKGRQTISTVLFFRNKEGIAGIYLVATRKEFRGRGYAGWLLCNGMNYLFEKGVRSYILHSTDLGLPVYKKLGFQENSSFGIYWKLGL